MHIPCPLGFDELKMFNIMMPYYSNIFIRFFATVNDRGLEIASVP